MSAWTDLISQRNSPAPEPIAGSRGRIVPRHKTDPDFRDPAVRRFAETKCSACGDHMGLGEYVLGFTVELDEFGQQIGHRADVTHLECRVMQMRGHQHGCRDK